jgi:YVTN family beta-propeller protein
MLGYPSTMGMGGSPVRLRVLAVILGLLLSVVSGGLWNVAQSKGPITLADPTFIDMGAVSSPYGVALSPDGSRAYVAANPLDGETRSKLVIVDTVANAVVKEVIVPFQAWEVAVTPDGSTVLVTGTLSGTVTLIDARSGEVIAELDAGREGATYGGSVFGLALSPDGATAYVALRTLKMVVTIDVASRTFTGRPIDITGGSGRFLGMPYDLAVSPDGAFLYVSNGYDKVTVVDTQARQVVHQIDVESASDLRGLAVTPDGRKLYAADFEEAFIAVIDTATRRVAKKISTTSDWPDNFATWPQNIVFSPDGTLAYVAPYFSGKVMIVDAVKDQVLRTIKIPPPPGEVSSKVAAALAISPDGGSLYVTDYEEWLVVLHPKWAPDPPGNVVAQAGDRQATISWTPPAEQGSDPVQYYTVTASRSGGTCKAQGVLTCTIKGLRNGTPYRFTVTATNSAGNSFSSSPSNAVTPGSARTIAIMCVRDQSSSDLVATCEATTTGIDPRTRITPYLRYISPFGQRPWKKITGDEMPVVRADGTFSWTHIAPKRTRSIQMYFRYEEIDSNRQTVSFRKP